MIINEPKGGSAQTDPLPLSLTPTEAAHQLHISRTKMYELLHQEVVPCIRLGRRILIPTQALITWLREQAASSTADEGGGDANG